MSESEKRLIFVMKELILIVKCYQKGEIGYWGNGIQAIHDLVTLAQTLIKQVEEKQNESV